MVRSLNILEIINIFKGSLRIDVSPSSLFVAWSYCVCYLFSVLSSSTSIGCFLSFLYCVIDAKDGRMMVGELRKQKLRTMYQVNEQAFALWKKTCRSQRQVKRLLLFPCLLNVAMPPLHVHGLVNNDFNGKLRVKRTWSISVRRISATSWHLRSFSTTIELPNSLYTNRVMDASSSCHLAHRASASSAT